MSNNQYLILKNKQQNEVNEFPLVFAFSNSQFEEAMKKLGLNPTDTDKVYKLGNTGGFYRKTDAEALHEMFSRHTNEMQEAIDNDTTGEGFIFDMFYYELANHEFGYTGEIESTLDALSLTIDEINASESLLHGLRMACDTIRKED